MRINGLRALGAALIASGSWLPAVEAGDFSYSYLEADWVKVDIDASGRVTGTDTDARVSSDDDNGFRLGGSWRFARRWHLFGEYSRADQDAKLRGTVAGAAVSEGTGFDVDRARIGVGYAWPFHDRFDLYGRVSFDWAELDDFRLAGQRFGDNDDTGPGAEIGGHWDAWRGLELELSVRYTDVGEVEVGGDFDDDILAGLDLRWWFTDRWAVQLGGEWGETTTWGGGVRVSL